MKKKQFFFCIILLISLNSISQKIKSHFTDSVSIYEINDSNFIVLLDSFIQFERKYYSCEIPTFVITNLSINNDIIELMSGYCCDSLLVLDGDNLFLCGILFYDNCRFLLRGRKLINDKILIKTARKFPAYFTNQVKIDKDDKIELPIDDSFFPTRRIYKFVNGRYILGYCFDRIE